MYDITHTTLHARRDLGPSVVLRAAKRDYLTGSDPLEALVAAKRRLGSSARAGAHYYLTKAAGLVPVLHYAATHTPVEVLELFERAATLAQEAGE